MPDSSAPPPRSPLQHCRGERRWPLVSDALHGGRPMGGGRDTSAGLPLAQTDPCVAGNRYEERAKNVPTYAETQDTSGRGRESPCLAWIYGGGGACAFRGLERMSG